MEKTFLELKRSIKVVQVRNIVPEGERDGEFEKN